MKSRKDQRRPINKKATFQLFVEAKKERKTHDVCQVVTGVMHAKRRKSKFCDRRLQECNNDRQISLLAIIIIDDLRDIDVR